MVVSKYVCLFMIYSLIGWVYESIYCTVKSGKWENRGFLYGPACPIYGTGAVAISILITLTAGADVSFEPWQIFLISVAGSAVLEYITSWALEKTFHALWWDYSYLPFNLNGRISLFTSLGFGGAGLIIVYYLAPATETLMSILSPLATEILALFFVAVFTVDMTLTVTALLHFDQVVIRMEENFNENMSSIVDHAAQRAEQVKEEISSRQKAVSDRLSALGHLDRSAVRRISSFRHKNKRREDTKNSILLKLKSLRKSKEQKKGAE